jgi:ribosomal protein S18 acetylase RimI-like enzyme
MQIKTLKGITEEVIVNTFNLSFSDYFIPFHLTLEQLSSKMKADKINLDLSVGVVEDEKLIAFILHGMDFVNGEKVIYNGGTGVIPEKRGKGLTKQMYEFILPLLKKQKIDYLLLEVISENIQAIKSYQKAGYKTQRELKCYKGQVNITNKSSKVEIKKTLDYDWKIFQTFWDSTPTWQNSIHVLNKLQASNELIGAYIQGKLVAYLIYNPKNKRTHQIAVNKNFRQRKIASTLVDFVAQKQGSNLSIINVDKSAKSFHEFLLKIGLEESVEQIEMKLKLID